MSDLTNCDREPAAVPNQSPAVSPVTLTSFAASLGDWMRNTTPNAINKYVSAFFQVITRILEKGRGDVVDYCIMTATTTGATDVST